MNEKLSLLNMLLAYDKKEPILLTDESGNVMTFEQVAILTYGVKEEKRLYCILKPLNKMEGIEDDEAFVFRVEENEDNYAVIKVEVDEKITDEVFQRYYALLKEGIQ